MNELESLVKNSYNTMIDTQRTFIDSCQRIQNEEPSMEEKIVNILDSLVRHVNIRQVFNNFCTTLFFVL